MEIEVSIGGFKQYEGATHASRLEFCLVFSIPSNAGRECVATALKMC